MCSVEAGFFGASYLFVVLSFPLSIFLHCVVHCFWASILLLFGITVILFLSAT